MSSDTQTSLEPGTSGPARRMSRARTKSLDQPVRRDLFLSAAPYVMAVALLADIVAVFYAAATATPPIFHGGSLSGGSGAVNSADALAEWLSSDNAAAEAIRLLLSAALAHSHGG
ncbi:hypothetical protein F6X40_24060 [Paraburkholderia sp. UCT31]|uniref:hypothetical protein n=1 Tax=Paraburkholderia sp. UCT31 TaxID=2615209 RepID=UPI001655C008|nr:hypothetical protein [Paraburkholderia sp. UCT31]MBC8739792.1 hypothetical protein [Paraburkholderia sp. UCT31]